MKEFADDNFKFDENGRKLSKLVENTVGKGEIARYKQFLLFPQCFQKAFFPGASNGAIVWEWVKEFADENFTFDENGGEFSKSIKNPVGKGDIARYEQFLHVPLNFQNTWTVDL